MQNLIQIQKGKKIINEINEDLNLPKDAGKLERMAIELSKSEWDVKYKLGHVIASLLEKNNNKGYMGGKYPTFSKFSRAELGMSESYSRSIAMAATCFTRQQFRQFGIAKCALVARLVKNPGDRRRAINMMADGKRLVDIMRVFAPNWKRSIALMSVDDTSRPKSFTFVQSEALKLSPDQRLKLAQALYDSVKAKKAS